MPYRQQKRNKPIASLIKWYMDKKSRKVSESRKEIQKRFDYLDWKDQKRILFAFLKAGKATGNGPARRFIANGTIAFLNR